MNLTRNLGFKLRLTCMSFLGALLMLNLSAQVEVKSLDSGKESLLGPFLNNKAGLAKFLKDLRLNDPLELTQCPNLESIGQMILTVPPPSRLESESQKSFLNLYRRYKIGGLLFLGQHFQLSKDPNFLIRWLNEFKKEQTIPPFLSIDHEGGFVQRLTYEHGLTPLPSAKKMAQAGLATHFEKLVFGSSKELRRLGFNWNYAPVLDVAFDLNNPIIARKERAFSSKIDEVVFWGRKQIEQMDLASILSSAKHFPGHGSTQTDSHLEMATVNKTWEALYQEDLKPFRQLNGEGLLPSIMVGHISLPKICGHDLPTSISACGLKTMLREGLGYQGVVITDALSMKAVTSRFNQTDAALESLKYGADIAMVSIDTFVPLAQKLCQLSQGQSGEALFWQKRIQESFERIVQLKRRYQFNTEQVKETREPLATPESLKLAREIESAAAKNTDVYR